MTLIPTLADIYEPVLTRAEREVGGGVVCGRGGAITFGCSLIIMCVEFYNGSYLLRI